MRPERNAAAVAEQEKVDIRLHTIIYNLTDEIKQAMAGLLAPVFKEVYKGKAEVRETFRITKVGTVAGCLVHGWHHHAAIPKMRLLRDNVVVHTGKIGSLRRFKDDVSEVKTGKECGITLENYSRRQAGRHHRSLRHRARGDRSVRLRMAAVGVLTLELRLENSHSLKDKRHVVRSLKDRLRRKFNVAVAEIDYQDLWQRAALAAVTVSSDHVTPKSCCNRWKRKRRRC